jgi:pantothenate kinase
MCFFGSFHQKELLMLHTKCFAILFGRQVMAKAHTAFGKVS